MSSKAAIAVLLMPLFILNAKSTLHKRSGGFLLTLPKTLVAGKNETVCLSLHEVRPPVRILIDLKWKDKHYTTLKTVHLDASCFPIKVPSKHFADPQFVSIRTQVKINSTIYNAHNMDPVLMYPSSYNSLLIQTDRAVYKPGDNVKFLILQLSEAFLPLAKKICNVKIKNPMGLTVMAWDDLLPNHGLASLEYQLPPEAMTGKWKLQVENRTNRHFEVAKYVLPRFKIELKYPKIVYYKADNVAVTVCGRYSYNKPVAGIAFIKMSTLAENIESVNKLSEMSNGCSEFIIDKSELGLDRILEKSDDMKIHLHIRATLTEFGTNKMDVATGKCKIALKGYNIKFQSNSMFIPGVPYQGLLKLTNIITNVSEELIEICYVLAIKKSWNYFNNEQCQNYTVSKDGTVPFKLWPFKGSVLHVHLNAKSLNNTSIADSFVLVRLFSPSSSYIQMEKVSDFQYKVSFSSDKFDVGDNVTFYHVVRCTSEILEIGNNVHTIKKDTTYLYDENDYLGESHKYVKLDTYTDQFILNFLISKKFITKIWLLVYYVTRQGETVAATKFEEIEPKSLQINSSWRQSRVVPGATGTLTIKSESPAICAVTATDKSSKFMSVNHREISLERVLKTFSSERDGAQSGRNGCVWSNKKSQNFMSKSFNQIDSDNLMELRRRKRHVYSFSEDYDAYDIFSNFGAISITNLQLVTKPCYNGPLVNDSFQVQSLTDHYETAQEESNRVLIRSFFPENWLWELVPIEDSIQLQRSTPHSITNWITNVFCVSKSEGIGVAEDIELTTFQAFFVDVLTPHSIKKGENFNLMVKVSNYANSSFPIKYSIRLSENLKLNHQIAATYCLKENASQTHNYPITGSEIGFGNVTVLVESDDQYTLPCGPKDIVPKRDLIFKTFQIEPEGYFMADTRSVLLCASKHHFDDNVTFPIRIPLDIVNGTGKVALSINADILGNSIENLHQLLTIPTGCGEQIMASMAPNVYVLRYLNSTGELSSTLRQRIVRNLKMGYQRILNYAHRDGSFSAFGHHDPSGSMFLTTFVVKILQETQQLIYVDSRIIDKAVNWIFEHQLENGCFDTMYHVFQDMGGTTMENSTAGLTAYVILSLFEAKVNVPDSVQTNAKYCIRSQNNPDKYSTIISSYALFKVHWISEARRYLDKAIEEANKEDSLMWWSTKGNDEPFASDIEMTSYGLLALMELKSSENMACAHSVAQWLVSRMSSTGGFKSTQDTIVALDALSKYSSQVRTDSLDLYIKVETSRETHIFAIKTKDRLKSKQVSLPNRDGEVRVNLSGTGCALIQLTTSYYTAILSESEAFKLSLEVANASTIDHCSIKTIMPCITYKGLDKVSNMAVMELELPSGFRADRSSLYQLTDNNKNIKMFEENDNQINIYFTNLDDRRVCFSFDINENLPVENRKMSVVKLYDYYKPEQSVLQLYEIESNCGKSGIDASENVPEAYLFTNQSIKGEAKSMNSKKCLRIGNSSSEHDLLTFTDVHINSAEKKDLLMLNFQIPYCLEVSLNAKTHVKRFAKENQTKIEPNCINVPFFVSYNISNPGNKRNIIWLKYKRETFHNDFVDMDIDLETPNCLNVPFYTQLPLSANKTSKNK